MNADLYTIKCSAYLQYLAVLYFRKPIFFIKKHLKVLIVTTILINMNTTTKSISTIEDKIAAHQLKLSQLKAKKMKLDAAQKLKDSKAARASDTRRKILLGAYLLDQIQHDETLNNSVRRHLDKWLIRTDERRLFNLPLLGESIES